MNGEEPGSGHAPRSERPECAGARPRDEARGAGFPLPGGGIVDARGRLRRKPAVLTGPGGRAGERPEVLLRRTMAEGPEEARDDGGGGDGGGADAAALRGAAEELPGERGKLSAREYSRQVHEWLWQAYCGYLTWHGGLAAVGYYQVPFYSAAAAATAAAGPAPGPATPNGLATPAAPGTRVAAASAATTAPSRSPSETGRQAGEAHAQSRAPGAGLGAAHAHSRLRVSGRAKGHAHSRPQGSGGLRGMRSRGPPGSRAQGWGGAG